MPTTLNILDALEAHYGPQEPTWPTKPYEFLVWWHCGYPASDAACARGWEVLKKSVGVTRGQILEASQAELAAALKAGGMVPELRAQRLQQIASRVRDEFGGDLEVALAGPVAKVRALLKRFPNIADPGADRILLFGRLSPVSAVPSNCPHVLVRIQRGLERENYGVAYREAQELIEAEVPAGFDARMRAFLLLKRHGQKICKRTNPKCELCPVRESCRYFSGHYRGRASRP